MFVAERLNRGTVVSRAAELADEIGLEPLTITKLGRALGIAPPGVYRHVADLTDLRSAIGQQGARELAAAAAAACAGRSEADALAALAATVREWAKAHPGRYAALQIAPDPDDAAGQDAAAEVLEVFTAALHGYALTGDDLTDAIRFIRSTLHGFVTLELGEGFKQAREVDASFERIVASLDVALATWN